MGHESGVSLAELVQNSFETYPQILRNVRLEDREKLRSWQQCEPLQQAIAQAGEDMGNTGRVLVRASGTEPLIRVMDESECPNAASHWVNYLVGVVETHLAA